MINLEVKGKYGFRATKKQILASTLDEFTNTLYCLTEDWNMATLKFDPANPAEVKNLGEIPIEMEEGVRANLKEDKIISFKFLTERESFLVILHSGTVLNIDNKSNAEVIAEMPNKILAAEWAPNEENLMIVSEKFLVLLDVELNPIKEAPIDDADENFEARLASISWAADGQVFAVCFGNGSGCKCLHRDLELRIVRSPAKEDPDGGVVQSVSEKFNPKLGYLASMMPSSAFVAGFGSGPGGETQVVFWEKNGLRHGEFNILEKDSHKKIKQIEWSLDGLTLAIVLENEVFQQTSLSLYQNKKI